jgi:hypothetical protein
MYQMDPYLKDRWVAALQSGKYQQGKGQLRKGDLFCCLGVLADVLGASWEDNLCFLSVSSWKPPVCSYLPPDILPFPIQNALVTMNDTGTSFEQVADWVKARL